MDRIRSRFFLIILSVLCCHSDAWASSPWQRWVTLNKQQMSVEVYPSRKAEVLGTVILLVTSRAGGVWPHSLAALAQQLPDDGWHAILLDSHLALRGKSEQNMQIDSAKSDSTSSNSTEGAPRTKGKRISFTAQPDLPQRIKAVVSGVKEAKSATLVYMAMGAQASELVKLLLEKKISTPKGMVVLNLPEQTASQQTKSFHKLDYPVLDFITLQGYQLEKLKSRRLFARQASQTSYRQIIVPPAGPNWGAGPDRITQRLRGWLKRNWAMDLI